MTPEGVPTPAPISDADSRAREERLRLVEERRGALPCKIVCDDGLSYGAAMAGPHCTGIVRCVEAGGCFWRRFHSLPAHMMRGKCDEDH